ncbi:MAG: 16S rRNA (cytidine(1402)-2'-O)-methyltransferase [Candidatus Sericytochromatia bacterium]|nr:16S rRNA (cytidine(1402)-2'-O)-methyltransferase [Candidatus Sericytochromatia bacterium]
MTTPGCLFLVATPIGNLEDLTLRALRVLGEVDRVAAEDTRVARKLLDRHGLDRPVVSCHEHTGPERLEALARGMAAGERMAFVSDAGTPGLSDPGQGLIRAALAAGVPVVPIPGPSALTCLLSVTDLPAHRFVFEGFLPREGKARRRLLRSMAEERRPTVFFEGPHRLCDTLSDLLALWGNRKINLGRELTKIHEEIFRGTLTEAVDRFLAEPPRGEVTMLVEGASADAASPALPDTTKARSGRSRRTFE